MDEIRAFAPTIVAVIAIATTVWQWISSPGRKAQAEVEAVRRAHDGLDQRLTRVESEVEHMPDKDTAHRMEMAIARLEGRLEVMDERLKPVAAMATRMQEHLMENGR